MGLAKTELFFRTSLFVITVLLASSALCVGALVHPNTFDLFFLCIQITIVSFCCTALIIMVLTNKSLYGRRHNTSMRLIDRYQLDENIRCGEYLIPVAINDVLCQLILVFLLIYSIYITRIPVGTDTTHLSHAYDMITAYQRAFFGVALTVRNEKFDHIFHRRKRSAKVIENQAAATSTYFNELKQMWS
ncbi:hypothetical protein OESDEN_08489 [Oesophagostomum dentatum]|uniref:Uncharacterized protein n=1 Tax=Oesophagostomum dentatum TaxID=61180 RepID=A0A0B1T7A5_OESDE|nr:hypothetical protein OESDEN_08489 [Oesophagostomum dentatum]